MKVFIRAPCRRPSPPPSPQRKVSGSSRWPPPPHAAIAARFGGINDQDGQRRGFGPAKEERADKITEGHDKGKQRAQNQTGLGRRDDDPNQRGPSRSPQIASSLDQTFVDGGKAPCLEDHHQRQ